MAAVETSFESIAAIDEVLAEILVRLPIIYLHHCKFVNKRWHSLIYSAWFGHLRLGRPKPPSFILTSYSGKFFYLSSDEKLLSQFNFSFTDWKVVQWCNGLMLLEKFNGEICCHESCNGETFKVTVPTYVVYNLTTGKSRVLPIRYRKRWSYCQAMSLAYEASQSANYKVIALMDDGYLEIYESEFRDWVTIGIWDSANTREIRCSRFSNAVYCNECVYMVKGRSYRHQYFSQSIPIWYLDLKTKVIEKLPQLSCEGYLFPRLFSSNDQLYCVFEEVNNGVIFVFELLAGRTGWLQTCVVDLKDNLCKHKVLTIVRRTTREKSFVLIEKLGNIISYPFSGDGVETIFDWTKWDQYKWARRHHWPRTCHWKNVYNFMESPDPV